jgi:hypothetical protein
MGYWVNTTYVNHGDVQSLANALEVLCVSEGMERVQAPSQRERLLVEPMQYEDALQNDLWGVAIIPGAPSWTVIQTAPLELLAERAPGAQRMRLANLCMKLSASAFQLNVYDSTGTILVEVSKDGEVLTSGFNMEGEGDDPFAWHDERLSEDFFEAQFRMHPFQNLVAGATLGEEFAEILAERFGGHNSEFCDNLVSVDTLINHKPLSVPGGVALYFKWPNQSRQRYLPCASWEEYRAAVRPAAPPTQHPMIASDAAASFRLGQRVRHDKFGDGVILILEGQGQQARVQVNFDREGTKWLMLAFTNLDTL